MLMKYQGRTTSFSAVLAAAMQKGGLNQVELSERTGIAISRLNNYLHGKYRAIKPEHLEAIVKAFGGPGPEHADLIQAYLLDALPEACRGLIDVRMPGARERDSWTLHTKGLDKEFAEVWKTLYLLCVTHAKIRDRTREWMAIMHEVAK